MTPTASLVTTSYTHDTVRTTYVEADGARFAYRRFGRPGATPVVFLQHLRGTMDNHDAATFIAALGLPVVDLLGHSMGGEVAQMIARQRPTLVRRLILVGTGPRGG